MDKKTYEARHDYIDLCRDVHAHQPAGLPCAATKVVACSPVLLGDWGEEPEQPAQQAPPQRKKRRGHLFDEVWPRVQEAGVVEEGAQRLAWGEAAH